MFNTYANSTFAQLAFVYSHSLMYVCTPSIHVYLTYLHSRFGNAGRKASIQDKTERITEPWEALFDEAIYVLIQQTRTWKQTEINAFWWIVRNFAGFPTIRTFTISSLNRSNIVHIAISVKKWLNSEQHEAYV